MSGAAAAAAAASRKTTRLSGSLSASGVGPTITSATVTIEMPSPTPRNLRIGNFVDVGAVTGFRYSKNGGALTVAADPTDVSFTQGDTIAVEQQGITVGESRTWDLTDQYTGQVIGQFVFTGV